MLLEGPCSLAKPSAPQHKEPVTTGGSCFVSAVEMSKRRIPETERNEETLIESQFSWALAGSHLEFCPAWLNYANAIHLQPEVGLGAANPPTEEMTGFQEGGGRDHLF